jgi:3-phenylpropionate/trans-cinnamate dioxygenase ferredoxin component
VTAEVAVARVADIPPGGMASVDVGGVRVVVANVAGSFYAVRDECTHDGAPLSEGDLEDATIVCPWHFSRFCLRTGAVLESPAEDPVRTHALRVLDGTVYVRLPAG